MTVDGWGSIMIGEAKRLYKDNLTSVTMKTAGDSKFARGCKSVLGQNLCSVPGERSASGKIGGA